MFTAMSAVSGWMHDCQPTDKTCLSDGRSWWQNGELSAKGCPSPQLCASKWRQFIFWHLDNCSSRMKLLLSKLLLLKWSQFFKLCDSTCTSCWLLASLQNDVWHSNCPSIKQYALQAEDLMLVLWVKISSVAIPKLNNAAAHFKIRKPFGAHPNFNRPIWSKYETKIKYFSEQLN